MLSTIYHNINYFIFILGLGTLEKTAEFDCQGFLGFCITGALDIYNDGGFGNGEGSEHAHGLIF